jgi:hypothetical protein
MVREGDEQYMNIVGFFFKIVEEPTFNKLNSFVQKYNILADAQNGFRCSRSMGTSSQYFM